MAFSAWETKSHKEVSRVSREPDEPQDGCRENVEANASAHGQVS